MTQIVMVGMTVHSGLCLVLILTGRPGWSILTALPFPLWNLLL